MKFQAVLLDDIMDIHCYNDDGVVKNLNIKIYDIETNFNINNFDFMLLDYLKVWNGLPIISNTIGFKVEIRDRSGDLVWSEIVLKKPTCKTKFVNNENMDIFINFALFSNLMETFDQYKNDFFDLKNSELIIDLGSSVGIFTAYALEQNPNIKSINVEMNPNFHQVCVDTFKNNPNIIPINAAIYRESDNLVEINSNKEHFNDLGNSIAGPLFFGQTYKTTSKTISLLDIIKKYNVEKIDLLKVDIEGYEYELFEHIDDNLLSKVNKIFLEFHPGNRDKKIDLINRLIKLGYKMVMLSPIDLYNEEMFTIIFRK